MVPRLTGRRSSLLYVLLVFLEAQIPPAAVDLLSHLLEFNPDKRYTVKQCLEHEYFDDIREKETEITAPKLYKDTNRTYNRAELKV